MFGILGFSTYFCTATEILGGAKVWYLGNYIIYETKQQVDFKDLNKE